MNMKVRGLVEPVLCERINIQKVELSTMDYRIRRQKLLKRAKHVEEAPSCVKNAQAQDVMHALAALYREMAEELEDSGLFERRFLPLDFAHLAFGDQSISAGQSHQCCISAEAHLHRR